MDGIKIKCGEAAVGVFFGLAEKTHPVHPNILLFLFL